MNFGEALQALKNGFSVKRSIWSGHWMMYSDVNLDYFKKEEYQSHTIPSMIVAVLKNNEGCAPAQPYQLDLLAEDWQIVE